MTRGVWRLTPQNRIHTVADYLPLLERAVARLADQTTGGRQAVYAHARTAMVRLLLSSEAPSTARYFHQESRALEEAIARLEAQFGTGHAGADIAAHAVSSLAPGLVDTLDLMSAAQETARPGRRQFALNAAASGAVSIFKALLQLALLPVMARLLGPTAYGVYALAFPTVMFFMLLADGGLGMSLAREDENNRAFWSTAFWTLLGTCSVMAVGVVATGFVLARISGQPSLVGIMAFLALALPLLAVTLPADARLVGRGNLLFHSGSDFIASIVGAVVAVVLAYRGAGAWSLAAQYITAFTIRAAILNAAAWSPPALVYDLELLRGHIATGGALLLTRLGELGGKLVENTAFGHIFGTSNLGSYTLGNQVSRFACDAVTNPVLGAFYSQILREADAEVAALHAHLTRGVLLVLLPATAIMAAAAPEVFPLVLGPSWAQAAPLFQAVVVPYALTSAAWLAGQVLLKHGMTERSAVVLLGCAALRVAVIGLGLFVTPVTVAWMVGATYLLQAVAMTLAVPRGLGADLRTLVEGLLGPASAAAAAAVSTYVVLARFPVSIAVSFAAIAVGSAVYLALLFMFDGRAIRADVRSLSSALRRKTV